MYTRVRKTFECEIQQLDRPGAKYVDVAKELKYESARLKYHNLLDSVEETVKGNWLFNDVADIRIRITIKPKV